METANVNLMKCQPTWLAQVNMLEEDLNMPLLDNLNDAQILGESICNLQSTSGRRCDLFQSKMMNPTYGFKVLTGRNPEVHGCKIYSTVRKNLRERRIHLGSLSIVVCHEKSTCLLRNNSDHGSENFWNCLEQIQMIEPSIGGGSLAAT